MKTTYRLIWYSFLLVTGLAVAQQDPQYSQYMLNTQVVNPAYVGSKEHLNIGFLGRTQWVGFDGAPQTITLTADAPVGLLKRVGLGLAVVHDEIGPIKETNINGAYSYRIPTGDYSNLVFGLKTGLNLWNIDFSLLNIADQGDIFDENRANRTLMQIGAGMYYYNDKFYAGLSVPNFLKNNYYTKINQVQYTNREAYSRNHYFLIMGYVFDLNPNLKFKPATLVKAVKGSPLQWDISGNFLFNEKFSVGATYRWDAALGLLTGFQISESVLLGFAYDYQTTAIENYSSGSYEVFLRFGLPSRTKRYLTPRFF